MSTEDQNRLQSHVDSIAKDIEKGIYTKDDLYIRQDEDEEA